MAQKGRKSLTTSSWMQCDNCLANFLNKDSENHIKDCPPNTDNFLYPFIKDNILYGTVDVKVNEDIKNLSSKEKDNLVFLSQAVIELCSLAIGNWSIIESLDNKLPPVARIVWPTNEKSSTSVLFTKNSLDLLPEFNVVKIRRLDIESLRKALEVSLVPLNAPKAFEISSDLSNRLQKTFFKRAIAVGNHIQLLFYGKQIKFNIKDIKYTSNTDLSEDLSNLNLNSTNKLFLTEEATKWNLFKTETDFNQQQKKFSAKIAGLDTEMKEIEDIMEVFFNKKLSEFNLAKCRSVLLYGHSGTGKTLLAKHLAAKFYVNVLFLSASDLYSKNSSSSAEDYLKDIFKSASETQSILILDEFDILCPSRSSRITDSEKRIVSTLISLMDDSNDNVFIIATTNKIDSIDLAFRRNGRLDREIEVPTPSPKARFEILNVLLNDMVNNLTQDDILFISNNTHGFVGADLVALCSRAALNACKRDNMHILLSDFEFALKHVRPSAMREVQIEVPNVKWTDIGGQEKLKLILKQSVEWPLKHADCFIRMGITPPKGVLMFGPPGCSKTMIAKALATESGLNFLSIKGPELFSKWVGESERAVREVFRKARQVAPSIIFFDEIDALGGERSSGSSTSVQERVLAQLLTELDGVSPLGDVTVLAATNRPDRIDKALLRPGRLDRIVYVPLPDDETRKEIFRIKLCKMPVINVNIDELVKRTWGYSGAEVNAICHEAAMMALEEDLKIQHVEWKHFEKALAIITPRTPLSLLKIYAEYLENKI